MKGFTISILCIVAIFFLQSCKKKEPKSVSFYHWKTTYSIAEPEQELLKKANSEKLYLRFFDLIYDHREGQVLPTATLQIAENDSISSLRIIPVIYITNEVFEKVKNPLEINAIADQTLKKIYRLKSKHFPNVEMPEIQIDCDWTIGTKDAYFSFLEDLQQSEILSQFGEDSIRFSATIRLHQVKFPEKTGIPPVDRGTIMFYNVGDLRSTDETNSILNIEKTASYLGRLKDYPLEYNVALPIFGWGVLYRDDQLTGIISDLDKEKLAGNFVQNKEDNWYTATSDAYIGGNFVYKGDKLRMENVSLLDLKKLGKTISKAAGRDHSVVLYHINSETLQKTDIDELLEILP